MTELRAEEEFKGELQREYALRFTEQQDHRNEVWKILASEFFQPLIPAHATLLDLGSGWGEFINNIHAAKKYGMDLNPDGKKRLGGDVEFLEQDCSKEWPLPLDGLDCVFTSNFFEHLPGKEELRRTLAQIHRCLRPGGKLICMGPNIRYLPGEYWDFWDHYLPLTERSLQEALELIGFQVERCVPKFLPYRMAGRRRAPLAFVRLYLKLPIVWSIFGKQFLVIASKRS